MPHPVTLPNPDSATTIGASLSLTRTATGGMGISMVSNAANGDSPYELTSASLTPAQRALLQNIWAAVDSLMKAARGYSP